MSLMPSIDMASCRVSNGQLLFVLLLLTGLCNVVTALKQVPLPHLDIFMLCSDDIRQSFDYVLELDGFYTDLLPSAADVTIDKGSQEFQSCTALENRTQVQIAADGFALLDEDSPFDQDEIQNLVTQDLLASYFENVCKELDTFEALVSDAGSEPQVGIATAWGALLCDFDEQFVETVARTGMVVGIISLVILCCCIGGCILFCCGVCS
mmetsp:Transcript_106519/g.159353  ORF Transcript_106519/g.159353 Transcript_106519/m.159353 type:complete len:209 (+) Transcript_106519:59-685(+)